MSYSAHKSTSLLPIVLMGVLGVLVTEIFGAVSTFVWSDWLTSLTNFNFIRVLVLILLFHRVMTLPWKTFTGQQVVFGGGLILALSLFIAFLGNKIYILFCLMAAALAVVLWVSDRSARLPVLILLGALVVNLVLAPVFYNLLSESILKLDAWLVFLFASWIDPGTVLRETAIERSSGFSVVLVGACSAFNSLSMALLAYLGWVVFRRNTPNRRDFLWLFAITAAILFWNVGRIALMGSSAAGYAFWHDSAQGARLIALTQLSILLGMSVWGERLCRR